MESDVSPTSETGRTCRTTVDLGCGDAVDECGCCSWVSGL